MLGDDAIVWIKFAGLSEQGIGAGILAQHARFAGLLNQCGHAVLANERESLCIFDIRWIELKRLIELRFGAVKVVAIEQAGSGNVGIFRLLYLALARCPMGRTGRSRGSLGCRGLGRCALWC